MSIRISKHQAKTKKTSQLLFVSSPFFVIQCSRTFVKITLSNLYDLSSFYVPFSCFTFACVFISFFLFLCSALERKYTWHLKIVSFMHSKSVGTTEQPVHISIVQIMASMTSIKLKQNSSPYTFINHPYIQG